MAFYNAICISEWQDRGAEHCSKGLEGMQELAGYSMVANCSGLGAAKLFKDAEMYPVRGHVIRVRAPWIK